MSLPQATTLSPDTLRIGLPKGRMHDSVVRLLADAGLDLRRSDRAYRPRLPVDGADVKILKPQNIVEMLHAGSRDVGFAGADWVQELGAEVEELLDTGFDPVRLVVAAQPGMLDAQGSLPERPLVVAGEYPTLIQRWMRENRPQDHFVRSYGATEVFPPEDADYIVDITQSGATLRDNGLTIVHELARSSTRLYASRAAMQDPTKRAKIENLVTVLRSVLEARRRVLLEVNVESGRLEELVSLLPCMREPTIAQLHGDAGYAVKAAVPRDQLASLIPRLKAHGGSDIIVSDLRQVVP